MATRRIYPDSDHGPNDGSPASGTDHYAQVDEYPNDGATTRVQFSAAGYEVFGVNATAVLSNDIVTGVTVRCSAIGAGAFSDFRFGWQIQGANYFGATYSPDLIDGYQDYTESFPTNPRTGLAWAPGDFAGALLVFEQIFLDPTLPRPAFSAIDAVADVIPFPDRADGEAASRAPAAAVSGGAVSGGASSLAPTAAGASMAPAGASSESAPTSSPASVAPSGGPATRAPLASAANLQHYRATPASLAPEATGASVAPSAAGAPRNPDGEVE